MQRRSGSSRAEAERLMSLAADQLANRNLKAAREQALAAQDLEPLLEGTDQIVAISDVLSAAEKRVGSHYDWYAILQIERRSDDKDKIKKQYRRLAFLVHPDKNRFACADQAFKLVVDAWSNLSDPSRKSAFDSAFSVFTKVNLVPRKNARAQATPVRRSERVRAPKEKEKEKEKEQPVAAEPPRAASPRVMMSFWTTCPYCYVLHQYPKEYGGCCLRCQSCNKTFEAVVMQKLPPLVPGKEAYYCCWGVFPVGFAKAGFESGGGGGNAQKEGSTLPNWMGSQSADVNLGSNERASMGSGAKRGRPRKNSAY